MQILSTEVIEVKINNNNNNNNQTTLYYFVSEFAVEVERK